MRRLRRTPARHASPMHRLRPALHAPGTACGLHRVPSHGVHATNLSPGLGGRQRCIRTISMPRMLRRAHSTRLDRTVPCQLPPRWHPRAVPHLVGDYRMDHLHPHPSCPVSCVRASPRPSLMRARGMWLPPHHHQSHRHPTLRVCDRSQNAAGVGAPRSGHIPAHE